MPDEGPLVLIGENNAGKSNVSRALDLILGERWPASFTPEDHDFYGRRRQDVEIKVRASTDNVFCRCGTELHHLVLTYNHGREGQPTQYIQLCRSCTNSYPNKNAQSSLLSVSIGAERNLRYQLSYSSRYTLLSRLMHRFHERLTGDEYRVEQLERIFRELLEKFQEVEEFQDFNRILSATTLALGQNIEYGLEVDFSAYNPSNFFRSLQVHPHFGSEVRAFDELGTGQLQVLAMAFAYAYARAFGQSEGLVLLIDEPESNLHPLAQRWLARQLRELSTEGLQIVIATHSPEFVDLGRPENLVRISKEAVDGQSTATQKNIGQLSEFLQQRGVPTERASETAIRSFYSAAATTETLTGLFARRCVLVEGPTEALALPELFRLLGYEPLRAGVAFISVDGISNVAKWLRLYEAYGIPSYAIFDTDHDKNEKKIVDSRTAQQDILNALELGAVDPATFIVDGVYVEQKFATLGPNFEAAMRHHFPGKWQELESAASEVVGATNAAKPLRARYAVQQLDDASISAEIRSRMDRLAELLGMTLAPPIGE